jgi:hypothetical protein
LFRQLNAGIFVQGYNSGIVSDLIGPQLGDNNSVDGGEFIGFVDNTGGLYIQWNLNPIGPISAFGGDFTHM